MMNRETDMNVVTKIEKMMLLGHSETVIADLIFAAFEDGELTRLDLRELMIRFASHHFDLGNEAGAEMASLYAEEDV